MLIVTTFSLTTRVQALRAATTRVTPRATRLISDDPTSPNVLAVFARGFVFSLVSIVMRGIEDYGDSGRVVLFAATLLVGTLILVTLLRWIGYLGRLGRVGETTRRVEEATGWAIAGRSTSARSTRWASGWERGSGWPACRAAS